jgi:hypothetical protein
MGDTRNNNRGGGKNYPPRLFIYKRTAKNTNSEFFVANIKPDTLEKLLELYPDGCQLMINWNDKAGEEVDGKKQSDMIASFKEPYNPDGQKNGNRSGGNGNSRGNSSGNSRPPSRGGRYDDDSGA